MESSVHKFYVSWFVIRVCAAGVKLAVDAWNDHPVSGMHAIIVALDKNNYTAVRIN